MDQFLRYYDHFVLPFAVGVLTLFSVIVYKYVRWFMCLPKEDRERARRGVFTRRTLGAIGETVCESLLHRRIWRVNPVLGYMHTSLALGWFLLIVVGWIESSVHFDAALMPPYTHVFFKFFGPSSPATTTGRFLGFLMDALLLFVLSGVALAWIKRMRSRVLGMRRTTRHTAFDRMAMSALWLVFPARLVAESATSGIDGGHTFLTGPIGRWMLESFGIAQLYDINAGAWWFYSLVLGVFFVAMPFSRYMHIFTEVPLIFLRRWGVRPREEQNPGDNFQIEACSRCGICLDPCQMLSAAGVTGIQAAYYLRDRRYHSLTREAAENCLMCGRCEVRCPVGVDINMLRLGSRRKYNDVPAEGRYDYLAMGGMAGDAPCEVDAPDGMIAEVGRAAVRTEAAHDVGTRAGRGGSATERESGNGRVGYFAGCMTLLSPRIMRAMDTIFAASGDDVVWADREGGVCCGRPLKLSGEVAAAQKMMEYNRGVFTHSGITTLVASCPICLKVFREDYNLTGIEVLHHSQYIERLIAGGRIELERTEAVYTYHDPCELGRGCGVYDEPRGVIAAVGSLSEPSQTREHAFCCGASLANVGFSDDGQRKIGTALAAELTATGAQSVVTACPLCRKSIAAHTPLPVADIAEVVAGAMR